MTKNKLSYARYLEGKNLSPLADYEDALEKIAATADTAAPARGVSAERLSGLGLSKSGYADYLANAAKTDENNAKADARAAYEKGKAAASLGYGEYLQTLRTADTVSKEDVIDALKKKGTVDEETAFTYAKEAGLPDAEARYAARMSTEETKTALKRKILAVVQRDGMGREHAVAYAIGQGLPEEDAEAIGDYAEAWCRIYTPISSLKEYN